MFGMVLCFGAKTGELKNLFSNMKYRNLFCCADTDPNLIREHLDT